MPKKSQSMSCKLMTAIGPTLGTFFATLLVQWASGPTLVSEGKQAGPEHTVVDGVTLECVFPVLMVCTVLIGRMVKAWDRVVLDRSWTSVLVVPIAVLFMGLCGWACVEEDTTRAILLARVVFLVTFCSSPCLATVPDFIVWTILSVGTFSAIGIRGAAIQVVLLRLLNRLGLSSSKNTTAWLRSLCAYADSVFDEIVTILVAAMCSLPVYYTQVYPFHINGIFVLLVSVVIYTLLVTASFSKELYQDTKTLFGPGLASLVHFTAALGIVLWWLYVSVRGTEYSTSVDQAWRPFSIAFVAFASGEPKAKALLTFFPCMMCSLFLFGTIVSNLTTTVDVNHNPEGRSAKYKGFEHLFDRFRSFVYRRKVVITLVQLLAFVVITLWFWRVTSAGSRGLIVVSDRGDRHNTRDEPQAKPRGGLEAGQVRKLYERQEATADAQKVEETCGDRCPNEVQNENVTTSYEQWIEDSMTTFWNFWTPKGTRDDL